MTRRPGAAARLRRPLASQLAAVAAALLAAGCGGGGDAPPPADSTAPVVADWLPASAATGVLTTEAVRVLFSEAMDTGSVEAAFTLTGPAGAVAGAFTWDQLHRSFRFDPAAPLTPGSAFTAAVGTGARDLAGNALAAAFSCTFSTVGVPEIWDTYPNQADEGVDTRVEVRVSFVDPMDRDSVEAAFSLAPRGGAPVAGTFRVTESEGWNLYFKPDASLPAHTTYDVVITTAAMDAVGTHLSTAWQLSFTTGAPVQRTLDLFNSPNTYWLNTYGRVVDDLGRLDCGGDKTRCSASYDEGTVVHLTALPGPMAVFTGWNGGGDCVGQGATATVTMDLAKSCAANFEIPLGTTALLSVTKGPWVARVYESVGFGQTPRLDCGDAEGQVICSYAFTAAIAVSLRAELDPLAPAGTIVWTCSPNDLTDPPTSPPITGTGVISPPIWLNQQKSCNASLQISPP